MPLIFTQRPGRQSKDMPVDVLLSIIKAKNLFVIRFNQKLVVIMPKVKPQSGTKK